MLLVAACSGSDDPPTSDDASGKDDLTVIQPGAPGEEATTGVPEEPMAEEPSLADIEFVQMMVPHHAQAIEMAELADKYAVDPGVQQMAARIRAAQGPEILTMSAWLEREGVEAPEHAHGSMPGMLTEAEMTELGHARGSRFDRLFLEGMIRHHQGAVQMAEDLAAEGTDVLVTEMAADVHVTQLAEIARMREILRDL